MGRKAVIRRALALLLGLCLLLSTASALTVEQARELLEEKYVADIPEEILALPTVEEILAALGDPYTRYLTAPEYQAFLDTMNDTETVGIGVTASMTEKGLTIVQALPGSPAEEAGLEAGSVILSIDGRALSSQDSLEDVSALLRGEAGSAVTLALRLPDGTQIVRTLTRRTVAVPHTTYALREGCVGWLDCRSFGAETAAHFAGAMEEYGGEAREWIVDLRSNGGGVLQDASDAAGLFLGRTVTGYLQDGAGTRYVCAPREGVDSATLFPVIVLTSGSTASAAEMFSGAIQANQGGLVIGERTFGKGVAQEMLTQERYPEYFPDGDAMTISAMRFYTAEGTATDQSGVLPHLVVSPESAEEIALLFGTENPGRDNENFLRLHLGSWRWYLNLERAEEFLPAFTELLEALSPDVPLFRGDGAGGWGPITPAELAAAYAPDYMPRTFSDAADSDYRAAIDILAVRGLLRGDGTGRFHPEESLTRAELCALLAQALNLRLTQGESAFADVPAEAWYAPAVSALYRTGLVDGCGGGQFDPDGLVTQEQLAVVLARTAAWLSRDFGAMYRAGPTEETLADPALTAYSEWAREGVCLMGRSMQDFLGGYISMMYDDIANLIPQAPITREETAESLYRVLIYTGVLWE